MQPEVYSRTVAPIIYTLISLLYSNFEFYHNSDAIPDRFRATYYEFEDTFDFIVVGAGSAGAVVANRLSNDNKVLLLEAGGESPPGTYIPGAALVILNRPYIDWNHVTVKQTHACLALRNKRAGWSAGKCLGGTSSINFMIYLRGHTLDYEAWANITGDPSWNYEGVLPHFKSIEDYHGEWDDDEIHGHGGELTVQLPPYEGMGQKFVDAGIEKGYPRVDLNGKFTEGFSLIYNNIYNGRRLGTYQAFIAPVRHRPNLTIYKFSQVNKVLLRGENNTAYGVEYIRHGVRKIAYARKEIIISAGTIHSPKILMLSGIGPRQHLESIGITTKVDLPVGQNIQDHISVYLGPFLINEPLSMILDRDMNSEAFTEFMQRGKGPMTSTGPQAAAFVTSSIEEESGKENWPDISYLLLGTGVYTRMDTEFAHAFHVDEAILKKYFAHAKGKDSFQIITALARPYQRGEILLRSKNPDDKLHIDPKYLHNDHDVRVLIEGIKRAVDLVENTTTFQNIGARFTAQVFPGCENVTFRSDAYWECYMRQYTITLHHVVGSCSMGKRGSAEAVVDPALRVIGTENLRVIDASVMPNVPVSNTNAPTMMIGEKGAYIILKEWENKVQLKN